MGLTVHHAAPRAGEMELLHRPSDADIGEAAFLFEFGRIAQRSDVGEHAVLHADEEHDGELEALGGVKGHQRDRGFLLVDVVGVADE